MHQDNKCIKQLSCCGLAVACGLTWGLMVFALTLFNLHGDWGTTLLDVLSSLYVGLDYSIKGALIGLLWGIGQGLLFGLIISWIYNFAVRHCFSSCCGSASCNNHK